MTMSLIARLVYAATITGAVVPCFAAPALADSPPNCTAGDRAQVAATVSAGTSVYLFTHPDINAFFTGLKGQPIDEIPLDVQDYLDGDPQAKAEIQAIRQPLTDFRQRCGLQPGQP